MLKKHVPEHVLNIASFCFLAGLLAFPFSNAAISLFLSLVIILSLYKSNIMKHGLKICWYEYRLISIGVLLFIACTLIGTLWSSEIDIALKFISKQFFWLLIPSIIGLIYYNPTLKHKAFLAISLALFVHLIVCSLQGLGILTLDIAQLAGIGGTGKHDPAGFFGHLNLGFIYGIWAGALLIYAKKQNWRWRALCYLLATYAIITVFIAQGRGGYLIVISLLLLIAYKELRSNKISLKYLILSGTFFMLILFSSYNLMDQNKIQSTYQSVNSFLDKDWQHANPRIKVWIVSLKIWDENKLTGVGTGDFEPAYMSIVQKEPHLKYYNTPFADSHNEFLFSLSRWGIFGLFTIIFLLFAWLNTGLRKSWNKDPLNAYLCSASGLALIINSFVDLTLSAHFASLFAILVLAFSMSQTPKDATHQA